MDADKPIKISDNKRIEEMLNEVLSELIEIQPRIDELECALKELQDLKREKQKLIALKLSLKSVLQGYEKEDLEAVGVLPLGAKALLLQDASMQKKGSTAKHGAVSLQNRNQNRYKVLNSNEPFYPEQAFAEASAILKQPDSTNFHIFRAIVFNGGTATTQNIKNYLVAEGITQPANGEGFENVGLREISARVTYLVNKGLVLRVGRGVFRSTVGWHQPV